MDTLDNRYVWVHEFGHYGYGNYDEYFGPGGSAECTDDGSGHASIMDGPRGAAFDEFCTPCNHDADSDTEHESRRNMSTWEWMAYGNLGLTWAPNGYVDLRAKWPWNCSDPADAHADPGPTTGYDQVTVIFKNVSQPNIVLLIDRSGSMSGQKITDAKNSAKVFVDLMQIGDMAGVVSYSSTPSVNYQLAEIVSEATKTTIKNAIDGISAGGMTAMGDGLRTAYNQLITYGEEDSPQAIVLLSNGWHNWGTEHPYDVIPDLQAKNIRVYTVGLGAGADETLMRNIADRTGGKYYFAASSAELQEIYNDISAAITGAQSAGSPEGEISQGEVVEEEVTVDSSIKQITFTLNWGGSDLDLTLRKPDGSIINPTVAAGDPNILFISEATYELYRVDNPESGIWTMIIEGVSVSGTETYVARVTAVSDISFYSTMPEEIHYPEPALISAVLQEDEPIIDANVSAIIIKDGESFDIELYDDGDETHGDAAYNDGVYSNLIQPSDPRYLEIFSEDGTYTIKITAESDGTAKTGGGATESEDVKSCALNSGGLFEEGPLDYVTIDEPFVREIITRLEVIGIPANLPPVADANGPYTGFVGSPITFNGTGSYDLDGTIVSYEWDLDDDGEFDDATGPMPSMTWSTPYSGIIRLAVTDDEGEIDIDETTLTVEEAVDTIPPTIESVTLDAYTTIPDATIHVTVEATDNVGVTSVTADGVPLVETGSTWEGDITAPSPTGDYTLTIRAEDDAGNFAETTVDYTVVTPVGGLGVAILPKISSTSAGSTLPLDIKVVSTENFDDVLHVYLTLDGIPPGYQADISWFNWVDTTVQIPAGQEIVLPIEVAIPGGISGYKSFGVKVESTKWSSEAQDYGTISVI